MSKPKFDPNKPFQVVGEKPKFDPNKPYEAVEEQPPELSDLEVGIGALRSFLGGVSPSAMTRAEQFSAAGLSEKPETILQIAGPPGITSDLLTQLEQDTPEFKKALAQVQLPQAKFKEQYPGTATVSEIAGSLYPASPENLLLTPGLELAGRGVMKGVKKAGAVFSGIPEKVLNTYEQRAKQIDQMYKKFGGDVQEAADYIRGQFQNEIRDTKSILSKQIDAGLEKYKDTQVDISNVIRKYMQKYLSLNEKSPADLRLLKDLKIIEDEINAVQKGFKVTVPELHLLKRKLQDLAETAYNPGQSIFVDAKQSAVFAKNLAKDVNKILSEAAPEIRQVNSQYEKLHNINQVMNKRLIKPETTPAALISAGGENVTMAKVLKRLGQITGEPMIERAENLAAMKAFGQPEVLSGITTGRALLGPVTGGALGGVPGAAIGAALGSPAVLKSILKAPQYATPLSAIGSAGIKSASIDQPNREELLRRLRALEE